MSTHLLDTVDSELAVPATAAPPRRRRGRRPDAAYIAALGVLALVVLWLVTPWLFTGFDPLIGESSEKLQAPSLAHWFGTDHLGRDLYSRVVFGTAQTLATAGLAVAIGFVGGTLLGLIAATAGSASDSIIMRFVDVLLAVPGFLISLSIVAAFGPGTFTIGIGVGIASISIFARVTRAEVLRVRNYDFVEAAFLGGGRFWGIVFRHILPNSAGPIISLVVVDLSAAILGISALGFLGFGAPPPTPEWGLLMAEGRNYLGTAWWMTTFPGLVIVIVVIALALVSRRLMAFSKI